MHRLLFTGLVGSGILAFGLAAPAQAMMQASSRDLASAAGGYGPGMCQWGTDCSYTIPAPSAQDCIDGNMQDLDTCYTEIGTAGQNGTCVGTSGNCFYGGGQLCVSYQAGQCVYTTGADGGGMFGSCNPINNTTTPIDSRSICAQLPG